jgi:hypothetical protein
MSLLYLGLQWLYHLLTFRCEPINRFKLTSLVLEIQNSHHAKVPTAPTPMTM